MLARKLLPWIFAFGWVFSWGEYTPLHAQELMATVGVQTGRLGTAEAETFVQLKKELLDMLNRTRWSDYIFSSEERIPCHFSLDIQSRTDAGEYHAHLHVTAQRPVYGSTYRSQLLDVWDREVNFYYRPFEQIRFQPERLTQNLTAIIGYYANLIIALNMDSFGELAADADLKRLTELQRSAAGRVEWDGWRTDELSMHRSKWIEWLTASDALSMRKAWYRYHRMILDRMTINSLACRTELLQMLESWSAAVVTQGRNRLLRLWSENKLTEIAGIMQQASREEKLRAYNALYTLFPTEENRYALLRQ